MATAGPRLCLDPAVRPQDDLDRHVNGRWSDDFALTGHRAEVSLLSMLAEKVRDDVAALVRAAVDRPRTDVSARQIADLWTSFMDEETIERRGTSVYRADLDVLAGAPDPARLAYLLGALAHRGVPGAVDVAVSGDAATARHHVLVLGQGGIGLPTATHYESPQHAALRAGYHEHARALLDRVGVPNPARVAQDAIRLETELAAHHVRPYAGNHDGSRAVSMTVAELAARPVAQPGGFGWADWLAGLGGLARDVPVCLRQSRFADGLDAWWQRHDIAALRHWALWRYLHEMAPFGPGEIFATNFEFFGRVVIGATEPRPRVLRAMSLVETVLGDALGERYTAAHLSPGTIEAVDAIVNALMHTYRERIESSAWMSPPTRRAALRKLDDMAVEIGEPRRYERRDELHIDPNDYFGNVVRGREWYVGRELARLGAPVDRSAWRVHPQQVTAYYRHGLNQVVVPAALLRPPVFDPAGDPARNFAVLGAIIAHEMTHAFDGRGSRYDHRGRARDWWAPRDRTEFARRTALLTEHLETFAVPGVPGQSVSGRRTLSEAIADVTGATVAHAAWLTTAPVTDPGRDTRRFFRHWATLWRAKQTPARAAERLATDPHAPPAVRCNATVGHVEAFTNAFSTNSSDRLHVTPERRFAFV
jgi:predicted metalloendopeptidase